MKTIENAAKVFMTETHVAQIAHFISVEYTKLY